MLKKKILSWAFSVKRRSRVYPVRVTNASRADSSSLIHDTYFKVRKNYLSKYVKGKPSNSQERQYTKSINSMYSTWFLEDVLAGSVRVVKANYKHVEKET